MYSNYKYLVGTSRDDDYKLTTFSQVLIVTSGNLCHAEKGRRGDWLLKTLSPTKAIVRHKTQMPPGFTSKQKWQNCLSMSWLQFRSGWIQESLAWPITEPWVDCCIEWIQSQFCHQVLFFFLILISFLESSSTSSFLEASDCLFSIRSRQRPF